MSIRNLGHALRTALVVPPARMPAKHRRGTCRVLVLGPPAAAGKPSECVPASWLVGLASFVLLPKLVHNKFAFLLNKLEKCTVRWNLARPYQVILTLYTSSGAPVAPCFMSDKVELHLGRSPIQCNISSNFAPTRASDQLQQPNN